MADDLPSGRRSDYRAARIGAAAALVFVVVFVLVFDALSLDYEASPIVLTALLGAIVTLLGLEAGSFLRGGGNK